MKLNDKSILITGGNSFLGKSLIPMLKEKGAKPIVFSSKEYNLTREEEVKKLFETFNPNVVIHLAVDCGGLKYKKENKGSMFYNNLMMDILVQEYSRRNNVEKFVGIGTCASYPEFVKSPIKEEDLWDGQPEEFNFSYGLAKKMMMVQSKAYREQYNFNAIHLIPVNLYGPNFSLNQKDIRVIPWLIKKFIESKFRNEKNIKLLGTPKAFREFLYVEDCAEAIIKATELYDKPEPINIGSGKSIKMSSLAKKVKEITGFKGDIHWKETYSDNQPDKVLDVLKAEKEFGFKAKTSLEEGLRKTVNWYLNNYKNL